MPVPTDFPKVAPDCIARRAMEAWLDRHEASTLRVVTAQAGAGKTAAVAHWARSRARDVAWIAVPGGATRSEVCALLMIALASDDGLDLERALRSTKKTLIVVDSIDGASDDARELLAGLPKDAPDALRFVYIARNGTLLDALHAARADASLLAFDDAEIDRLLIARGVAATPPERRRLLAQTGGWATAVAGTVRYAAAIGCAPDRAFERWITASRTYIDDLVSSALAAADGDDAAAFTDLLAQRTTESAPLARLAHAGLFVEDEHGTYRVNPVVAALEPREDRTRLAPALLHVFGRFRMTIGDREVAFVRRRDRQLVAFLALQPDGAASREAVIAAICPEGDAAAAAQALRSACTTIRRAIGECAGRGNVNAYFRADATTIQLVPDRVTTTLQRFTSHVALASDAQERNALDAAYAHWCAALAIHVAPLLAGEPPAAWIEEAERTITLLAAYAADQAQSLAYVEEVRGPLLTA